MDLHRTPVETSATRLLPRAVAERHGVLVLGRENGLTGPLRIAVVDPTDVVALDDVRMFTGGQRPGGLLRRPCTECTAPDRPDARLLEVLGIREQDLAAATPMRGRGCHLCAGSGHRGRLGEYPCRARRQPLEPGWRTCPYCRHEIPTPIA